MSLAIYVDAYSGYKAIIFDRYGTLAAPSSEDFWNRMPEIIERAGRQVQGLTEWEASPLEHEAQSQNEATYRAWQAERLLSLFKRCGITEPRRSLLLEEISAIRYQREFDIYPEVPHVLQELRNRGLPMGLCSNWDWDLDRHLHHNQIHGHFDAIVCSASAGFRKPHSRIFEMVIDRMGISPEHMLFVGDSWSDDVEGATAAGFQSVHIARTECQLSEHSRARCIRDLNGLFTLL